MDNKFIRLALPVLTGLSLLLSGCGGVNIWPFSGEKNQDRLRTPSNATEYHCTGGKRFYLRYLDNGGAAWIIFPDREFRLGKVTSDTGTRYSNGIATLDINSSEATLVDGTAISFAGCKAESGK